MTKDELIEKLNALSVNQVDIETDHADADQLLLNYIDDTDVTATYNSIKKWYG